MGNATQFLPTPVVSPPIANCKIQFVLNNVYKPVINLNANSNDYNYYHTLCSSASLSYVNDNAINVFYFPSNNSLFIGSGDARFYRDTRLYYDQNLPTFSGSILGDDLLAHELAHVIGALGDHYSNLTIGPLLYPHNTNNPIDGWYKPNDAALDILQFYSCNPIDPSYSSHNNNIMGNSFCREYISAKQIAAIHYLVAMGVTKKYTQFLNSPYPGAPGLVEDINGNADLYGTQTFNSSFGFSNIITIKSGAVITFNNINIFPSNHKSKIIVEPGGRLILNNTTIISASGNYWQGIEVHGNMYAPQNNINQGQIDIVNSCISGARIGVLAGKSSVPASNLIDVQFTLQSSFGGGIINALNSTFENNLNSVVFDAYQLYNVSNPENLSIFQQCYFKCDNSVLSTMFGPSIHTPNLVYLSNVNRIRFTGCNFKQIGSGQLYGIKSFGSSVSLTRNNSINSYQFLGDFIPYAVYLDNSSNNNLIDGAYFISKGQVFINGGSHHKIVKNLFNLNSTLINLPASNETIIGLYLLNTNSIKIENNNFDNSQPGTNTTYGLIVHNSGPFSNNIYNNSIKNMDYGVWCQNQNYDPTTGNGLKINCNDFVNCNYNIGVQNSAPFSIGGIDTKQGVTTGGNTGNSRNKYNTLFCFNENKFYVNTQSYAYPQITHANFIGNAFRVDASVNYCSDPAEVDDIPHLIAPSNKLSYCPDNSLLPKIKNTHNSAISIATSQLLTLNTTYNASIDGGNTQNLLNLINGNNPPGQVKNQLMAAPYLSDTVMITYFNKANTPNGHAKDVFVKNAPASSKVWQTVINKGYPNGIFNQMQSAQNAATVSPRSSAEGQISLVKAEQSYQILHKALALYSDSSNLQSAALKDSLSQLITLNNQGQVSQQLIELDVNFADYKSALVKAQAYNATAVLNADKQYAEFMLTYINLLNNIDAYNNFNQNSPQFKLIDAVAKDANHPCQSKAQALLFSKLNQPYEKVVLSPPNSTGSRLLNNPTVGHNIEELAININIYPNPAQQNFYISNGLANNVQANIYNSQGQLMQSINILTQQKQTISTNNLLGGFYLVTLLDQDGKVIKTQKIIIEK
jgi:hypothetical protein